MTTSKALSEADVEAFLTKLKNADTDKKVDVIQLFGLRLEDVKELPSTTLDALTLSLAPLLRSTSHLLIAATLTSFLPFYLSLIPASATEPDHLHLALIHFLPSLLEKLNDPKDRIHKASATCVIILGRKCYEVEGGSTSAIPVPSHYKGKEKEKLVGTWERLIKETLTGKGWRGKVECMKLLLAMRSEQSSRLPLKPWLPILVDLLEDGDGNVRDQARETTVALLSPAETPPAAKSELKKLLLARNVRKTISDNILNRVLGGGISAVATPASEVPGAPLEERIAARSRAVSPTPAEVEVVYVASGRDLESEFARMVPFFEGKETEHNWAPREKSLVRMRGMLRGQAYHQHPDSFVSGLKTVLEGIGKTLMSLRTTVAQQACALVLELAENLKSGFDHSVETLLPILGKMAGFTKKIIADKSQKALTAIITYTTVPPRIFISHILAGMSEKNVQTRQFCTGHLKTFLDIHAGRHQHSIESSQGGLELLETAVKKALADVNPAVRDLARAAFWSYEAVWPRQGGEIMAGLDGVAKKQLEKANPRAGRPAGPAPAAAVPAGPTGKAPTTRRVPSAISAMLAEKRKAAKAAELGAANGIIDVPPARSVSSPIPKSPAPHRTTVSLPKSSSPTSRKPTTSSHAKTPSTSSSPKSRELPSTTPRAINQPRTSPPHDLLSRSRSSSFGRTLSSSPPPSSRGSPSSRMSPLRQTSTLPTGLRSPVSSSATSGLGTISLRTPTLSRKVLPSSTKSRPVGIGISVGSPVGRPEAVTSTPPGSSNSREHPDFDKNDTPTRRPGSRLSGIPSLPPVEALDSQAAQAVSAARQLIDYEDELTGLAGPATPIRGNGNGNGNGSGNDGVEPNHRGNENGNTLFRTPMNGSGQSRRVWEDSPRNEPMTPMMIDKLKERKHERSWWLRRQQLLDKATPLKSSTPSGASTILADLEALEADKPEIRNLQKLALFSTSHPISLPSAVSSDEEAKDVEAEVEDERKIWDEGRLFARLFDGLMGFLRADKPADILEQALVLLWEMIQNQWILFEDHDIPLCDALFRLRASRNGIILESTNSLLSLLTEVSDPLFLLSVIRASLDRYLANQTDDLESSTGGLSMNDSTSSRWTEPNGTGMSGDGEVAINTGEKARAAGYLFGLYGIGMCLLKLPSEVVEVEAAGLNQVIMDAFNSSAITTRQAANTVLLAIQCVLKDPQRSLALFPGLKSGQKDLAMYLMEKNGLLSGSGNHGMSGSTRSRGSLGSNFGADGSGRSISPSERVERVKGEMAGLMARGSSG